MLKKRVLIAGCGYVGTALAKRLLQDGHSVWGLRRNTSDLAAGISRVTADLTDQATLAGVPDGMDVVVYCPSSGGSTDEVYQRVYVEGLKNLCAVPALRVAKPRLLFVSSTSVYAQDDGSWVTEDSETKPMSFAGRRTIEAENVALSCGYAAVILRCGGIYGPGRNRLLESVRSGSATYDPNHPTFTNRIHRDDVAGALLHLMCQRAVDPIYIGVDTHPAAREEVLLWIAERLKVPPPRAEAEPASGRGETAGSKRCSNARLLACGYRFLYPTFRDGYAALLTERATLSG